MDADKTGTRRNAARTMKSSRLRVTNSLTVFLFLAMSLAATMADAADSGEAAAAELQAKAQRVQDVIDDLKGRLSLTRQVTAAIVPQNPLMVSVLSPLERGGAYRVAFEGAFLDSLSDQDLRAVVAHELGHVWIFTHHPYLQTEQLANKVALRVVTRDTLERVYDKVWPHGAPTGAPVRFSVPAN